MAFVKHENLHRPTRESEKKILRKDNPKTNFPQSHVTALPSLLLLQHNKNYAPIYCCKLWWQANVMCCADHADILLIKASQEWLILTFCERKRGKIN
jgi:hypothetical protein